MQAHTLTVGDRQYRLRTQCDVAALSDLLTEAVRLGGGMVRLPVAGETHVSVLVSPGTLIVLETHEVAAALAEGPAAPVHWPAIDDLDF
ncbi:hypothetical protein [Cryobacterium arcticum]|uniref:Uncharacterized protein n=1 Tax=Cryobacterium arcticum TaxID=670052 RepID=A0A317ZZ99_9MICO|nr:hypothetical protein [Cryobacterium arcticum]PXA71991.1 hypothetical protein CTB96_03505 [Cryobacterium arcticum]